MRRRNLLFAAFFAVAVFHAQAAAADSGDDIGTRPAQKAPSAVVPEDDHPAPPRPSPSVDRESGPLVIDRTEPPPAAPEHYRVRDAPVAKDPPGDWYVAHAGLRPHLGTFGGLGTFALAHGRTERFYGALSLSIVRNDAGTHVGAAQVALG